MYAFSANCAAPCSSNGWFSFSRNDAALHGCRGNLNQTYLQQSCLCDVARQAQSPDVASVCSNKRKWDFHTRAEGLFHTCVHCRLHAAAIF